MFPPSVGGSERYACELANSLGARDHTVDVYTQAATNPASVPDIHANVTIERITRARRPLVTFETLYYSLQARRRIDFSGYDVIHGTLMPASTIALTPRFGSEIPIVVTSHGTSIDETLSHTPDIPSDYLKRYLFHPLNVVMDTVAGHTADHIIAISQQTRNRLIESYRFAPEKVTLIPHGVDTNHFAPQTTTHPAVTPNQPTLLFVGRLVSRKGADLAIECLANLQTDDCKLLIAGTGRHANKLKRLTREHGVADRVDFLGFVPDDELPSLYSSVDALVFASRYEGFGLVFLEAMACGTPVIATPVGGVPDVVVDGESGLIVSRNPAAMAQQVDELLTTPEKLREMGESAHRRASDMDWRLVAREVESLYESITRNR